MERPRPSNISLPSVKSILDETNKMEGQRRKNDAYFCVTPRKAPLAFSHFNIATPNSNRPECQTPTTPKPERPASVQQVYPSPASDDLNDDVEMSEGSSWYEAANTPLFKLDDRTIPSAPNEKEAAIPPRAEGLTPSIVHYRPNGIPNVRSRKLSLGDIQKPRHKKSPKADSNELKIRMVKWDRVTDKGTAPLNVEPRPTGPRSCTLCSLTKRKCDRTDGQRPNETHPCAACQKHNFVCQFIAPSQLRDGTTQAPSLEALKLYTDQAQRLRTLELEEKIIKLEHSLEMSLMENRIQNGYISNLKVYEGIVNGYILKLKERLEELDPTCRLLEYRIPAMPEKISLKTEEGSQTGLSPLSDAVDDMPVVESMDVDPTVQS